MESLLQLNKKLENDADLNAALRSNFRKDRKAKKQRLGDAASAGLGRGIEMLGEADVDVLMAKSVMRSMYDKDAHKSESNKLKGIRASGIFASKKYKGTKRLEGQGLCLNRTKRSEVAVNLPVENYDSKQSAGNSALAALAAYGSDSDSSGRGCTG
jgi:hypothetical protein